MYDKLTQFLPNEKDYVMRSCFAVTIDVRDG